MKGRVWNIGLVLLLAAGCAPSYPKPALMAAKVQVPQVQAKKAGPCSIGRDWNDDGKIDQWTAFTYNKAGKVAVEAQYSKLGGRPDLVTRSSYDGKGNLVREIRKTDAAKGQTDYAYDAKGHLVKMTVVEHGRVQLVVDYDYNAVGQKVRETQFRGGSRQPASVILYRYNSKGELAETDTDSNGDGKIDRKTLTTYDARGNKTIEKIFWGDSKTPGLIAHYYYDEENNRIRKTVDENGDGKIDREILYKVDKYGNAYATTEKMQGKTGRQGAGLLRLLLLAEEVSCGFPGEPKAEKAGRNPGLLCFGESGKEKGPAATWCRGAFFPVG